MKDGYHPRCRICWKQFYLDNQDRKKLYYLNNRDRIREYCSQNRDRIKEYQIKNRDRIIARKKIQSNIKNKSDINLCLICKTRSRIHQALRGKLNPSSTRELLGIDVDT